MKRFLVVLLALVGYLSLIVTPTVMAYNVAVHSEHPKIATLRSIWIETAMTTASHQWLATALFPQSRVDEVMSAKVVQTDIISTPELMNKTPERLYASAEITSIPSLSEILEDDVPMFDPVEEKEEELDYIIDKQGNKIDSHGNKIIVDDQEQDIRIVEFKTAGYTGRILMVDDPSRVVVTTTKSKGTRGQFLKEHVEKADGIAGINANGFSDAGGNGHGGEIIGWTVSEGKPWGAGSKSHYISAGFDTSDRFIVGNMSDFEKYNMRDLSQWMPALVVDGDQKVSGTAGWGVQPRTAIAQTKTGQVLFAVVDGRQPGHSLGITVGELADILVEYGAYNAALCDGGSSSTMIYDGEMVGKVSTFRKDTGRFLPNAWVVKRKDT